MRDEGCIHAFNSLGRAKTPQTVSHLAITMGLCSCPFLLSPRCLEWFACMDDGKKNADGLDKSLFPHERRRGGLWVRRTSRTNAFLAFLAAPPGGIALRLIWPFACTSRKNLPSFRICLWFWDNPCLVLPFSFSSSFFRSLIFVVITSL